MSSLKKFRLWFLVNAKLYTKKILKNEVSINREVIIIWELFINIFDKLLDGKKPPDETTVIARFKELNNLILNMLRIIKIPKVINE